MSKARIKTNLSETGISNIHVRWCLAGGVILEIPVKDNAAKANDLDTRLSNCFPRKREVGFSHPIKMAVMGISGLDDSVTRSEVAATMAENGVFILIDKQKGAIRQRTP